MNINKIAIVGISGSGKSTLARELAKKSGLPLFHMDTIFWKGNWEDVPESEYLAQHQELLKNDRWIIEGYIDEKMSDRVRLADQIIYLDYGGVLCFWRVFMRWLKHRKESRPELPREALDRFAPKYWWVALTREERRHIESALHHADQSHVVRLHSLKELKKFLNK